eukprot:12408598-Karenia_brevis.AAC.1
MEAMSRSMVIGRLGIEGGKDAAEEWLKDKYKAIAKCSPPTSVFSKEEFKGMLFARFSSKDRRDIS